MKIILAFTITESASASAKKILKTFLRRETK
jgi:hypothetical protein